MFVAVRDGGRHRDHQPVRDPALRQGLRRFPQASCRSLTKLLIGFSHFMVETWYCSSRCWIGAVFAFRA